MPEWVLQVLGIVGGATGVYAAIRADLAYLRAKVENANESAASAHKRLDALIFNRNRR